MKNSKYIQLFSWLRALHVTHNSYMKAIRNVTKTAKKFKDIFGNVPLPRRYGWLVDSTINIEPRAGINDNKIQFFFFVTLNKMFDNTKPNWIRPTDSVNSTLNNLKFCTPLTNLIKTFGTETRVLSRTRHIELTFHRFFISIYWKAQAFRGTHTKVG